jgi:hypothetical protein
LGGTIWEYKQRKWVEALTKNGDMLLAILTHQVGAKKAAELYLRYLEHQPMDNQLIMQNLYKLAGLPKNHAKYSYVIDHGDMSEEEYDKQDKYEMGLIKQRIVAELERYEQ